MPRYLVLILKFWKFGRKIKGLISKFGRRGTPFFGRGPPNSHTLIELMHSYNQTSPKNKIICKTIFRTVGFSEMAVFGALSLRKIIKRTISRNRFFKYVMDYSESIVIKNVTKKISKKLFFTYGPHFPNNGYPSKMAITRKRVDRKNFSWWRFIANR